MSTQKNPVTPKIPGIAIVIGGIEYIVPPINLTTLMRLEDQLKNFTGGTDIASVQLVVDAAHSAIKRNYPLVTVEEISDGLDVGNMEDVMRAVMDVSGLRRKEADLKLGEVKVAMNQ